MTGKKGDNEGDDATVLVTGACGFVGANLVRLLLDETEWEVRAFDNLRVGTLENLPDSEGIEFVKGDLRVPSDVRGAVDGCRFVVNLAAQTGVVDSIDDPRGDAETNVNGLLNLLEASADAGVESFVQASSAAPLGEAEMPLHEERVPEPLSPYGASKLAGEGYCSAYAHSRGLDSAALRFSNVYGPHSPHKSSAVHLFIRNALEGEEVTIYGDGGQTRDFVYVGDVCGAVHTALTTDLPDPYELLQIGTGTETSVNELYGLIREALERRGFDAPDPVHAPAREGEIYRNYADVSKARDLIGYEPSVGLRDGLERTVDWYLENLGGPRDG